MSDLDRLVGSLRLYADAYDGEASQYADDDYQDEQRECAALAALLTDAAATITRLREALDPFAEAYTRLEQGPTRVGPDIDHWPVNPLSHSGNSITLGDLRRARQALGGEHG